MRAALMTISLRTSGYVTIVDVVGRLTAEWSAERFLVRTVRRLLHEGHRHILLNLEGVCQIDSSGLSELVEAYTTTTRQGGQLKLTCVRRRVSELLRITHLARVFDSFDGEPQALASFAGR